MGPSARPWRPLRLLLVTETFPPEVNGVARTNGPIQANGPTRLW